MDGFLTLKGSNVELVGAPETIFVLPIGHVVSSKGEFDVDDEKGTVSFKKRQINTLVKAKKNRKTGEVTYDYSGLASTISNIVIKHYFA